MVNTSTGSGALVCSRKVIVSKCEPGLYDVLIEWIRNRGLPVRSVTDPDESGDIPTLSTQATFYSFVFVRRHKYSATRLTKARTMGASLVQVRFPDIDGSTWTWCGVIKDLVELVYGKQHVLLATYMSPSLPVITGNLANKNAFYYRQTFEKLTPLVNCQ